MASKLTNAASSEIRASIMTRLKTGPAKRRAKFTMRIPRGVKSNEINPLKRQAKDALGV